MSITLQIGGVVRSYVSGSLSMANTLGQRDTATFSIVSADGSYIPTAGQSVFITESVVGDIFGGTIDSVAYHKLEGSSAILSECRCVSHEQMCDRRFTGQRTYVKANFATADLIVADLVANALTGEGVTTSLVTAPAIDVFELDYSTVAEALNKLAELCTNATDTWTWDITPAKVLRFYKKTTYAAPFSMTDAAPNCLAEPAPIVTKTREKYTNRVYVRLGQYVTDPATESFTGNSSARSWVLTKGVGAAPTVKVNTVAKTVGVLGVDTGKDFYWSLGSNEIRQDGAGVLLTISDTLAVTYQGIDNKVMPAVQDTAEINARAAIEGGTGYYESLQESNGPTTAEQASGLANAILAKYGKIPTIWEATTRTAGLRAGQALTINFTALSINSTFLVESVNLRDENGDLRWAIRAVDGALLGNWVTALAELVGPSGGAVGTAAATSSTGPTAPGNVTITGLTATFIEPIRKVLLTATYTAPSPIGTFKGVQLEVEAPDQSTDTAFTLDGTSPLDGTRALQGERRAQVFGPFDHAEVNGIISVYIDDPAVAETIRVRLVSYSDQVLNASSASPSTTVAYTPAVVKPNSGIEYAPLVQGLTLIGPAYTNQDGGGQLWSYGLTWAYNTTDPRYASQGGVDLVIQYPGGRREINSSPSVTDTRHDSDKWPVPSSTETYKVWVVSWRLDGKKNTIVADVTPSVTFTVQRQQGSAGLEIPLVTAPAIAAEFSTDADGSEIYRFGAATCTPPADARFGYVKLVARNTGTGKDQVLGYTDQNGSAAPTDYWPLLSSATFDVYFVSVDTFGRENTLVPGTTPKVAGIAVAPQTTGSLKAARLDPASLASSLAILGGLLGVPTNGIQNTHIVSVAAAKITAGTLAAGVIYAGTINANQINAGTLVAVSLSGGTLTLNLNGATTTIDNSADANGTAGLKIKDNANLWYSLVTPQGFFCVNASGVSLAQIQQAGSGSTAAGSALFSHASNGNSVNLRTNTSTGSVWLNGLQIIMGRQTGPGNTTDGTDVAVRFNNLLTALRTHGLIT